MKIKVVTLLALLIFLFSCNQQSHQNIDDASIDNKVLILVSLDGFRNDYLDSIPTPTLQTIIQNGARAEALIPCFPSKTFPNHYSIVTGLFPSNHGIIGNTMYDPVGERWFRIGSGSSATRDASWFDGEPIWVTAEKQHKKTATLFWPGSDAPIQGIMPTYHRYYDGSTAYQERVQQVLEWLKLPSEERPEFISLYFESPDREGHKFGPFSPETRKAVEDVDRLIGSLMDGIKALNMQDRINIMITSDHGMSQLSRDKVIFLDDYIDLDQITLINQSPNAEILCNDSIIA